MAKPVDPRTEQLELGLLVADAAAAGHLLLAPNADQLGNVICFPLLGLVTEEALTYFAERGREARIGSLDGTLRREFRGAVKKVRARLKLLDDTDKGHEELAAFMRVTRMKSRVLFEHPSSRLLQLVSGPFRPDLGAFFAGEYLVGTSHGALSTMGVTRDLVEAARPGEFTQFETFVKEFAISLGAHLATLRAILAPLGLSLDLQRRPLASPVTITHLDRRREVLPARRGGHWPKGPGRRRGVHPVPLAGECVSACPAASARGRVRPPRSSPIPNGFSCIEVTTWHPLRGTSVVDDGVRRCGRAKAASKSTRPLRSQALGRLRARRSRASHGCGRGCCGRPRRSRAGVCA